MTLADEANEIAAGLSAQEKKERYEAPGDNPRYPAPGVALKSGNNINRNPGEDPPRNIIAEGTPDDLPDRNNQRTPVVHPQTEGSNPAGYGELRDGARSALKAYRQESEKRMFHKFMKWQQLNQAGRLNDIKNAGAREEL
jgi:hypothetical protein